MKTDRINTDKLENIEKAERLLLSMKGLEEKTRRYTWRRGSLIVSYKSLKSLKYAVKALGYNWKDGTLKK